MIRRILPLLLGPLTILVACRRDADSESSSHAESAPPPAQSAEPASQATAPPPAAEIPSRPDPDRYGWLKDDSRPFPEAATTLGARFRPPRGYDSVAVPPGSFGEWLRHLPVADASTPVVTHAGDVVYDPDDPYIAGVLAIDVGKSDLQHGPDVIIRLHAEYLWAKGQTSAIRYTSVTRLELPFERWVKGERPLSRGGDLAWTPIAKPIDEAHHRHLRDYLDTVFNWANSRSLLGQAAAVDPKEVRPGDFLVHEGKPGDAVIIMDMARSEEYGRTLVMVGRALSPAQSIHVASPGAKIAWFEISPPSPLLTPHTEPFEWSGLRRME